MSDRGWAVRFVEWGHRAFSENDWHRVAFQPTLYLFMWAAIVRVIITQEEPIRFEAVAPWLYGTWAIVGMVCAPLAGVAWYLIVKSRWQFGSLFGCYLRLGADVGMFLTLLSFHLVRVLRHECHYAEENIFSRYMIASLLAFLLSLVVRDLWAITSITVIAKRIDRRDG